jgi:hypothetical protein
MAKVVVVIVSWAVASCGANQTPPQPASSEASVDAGGDSAANAALWEASAQPGSDAGCDYADPTRRYAARGSCANIDWGCMSTQTSFQNACGCGCILPDGGN